MKAHPHSRGRKLNVQPLESRQLMAGEVTAFLDGETLFIIGDRQDNDVVIDEVAPHSFPVRGGNAGRDGFTSVNGRVEPATFAVSDINMQLRDGNDLVRINGLDVTE